MDIQNEAFFFHTSTSMSSSRERCQRLQDIPPVLPERPLSLRLGHLKLGRDEIDIVLGDRDLGELLLPGEQLCGLGELAAS